MFATEWELRNLVGIIYLIQNNINNKVYIGQTLNTFCQRYSIYTWYNNIDNIPLSKAIKKYGYENFSIKIIESNKNQDELDQLETFYIQQFQSNNKKFGYNINRGGKRGHGFSNQDFINKSIKIHKDLYDYRECNYLSCLQKVKIFCKTCREFFFQLPPSHFLRGCPKCSHRKAGIRRRIPIEQIIEISKNKFGDIFIYNTESYAGRNQKIEIFSKKCGHSYKQTWNHHLKTGKCPICSVKNKNIHNKSNKENFIKKSQKIHGIDYDYSDVEYINSETKVKIKHLLCNRIFYQTPDSHIQGHGCNKCAHKKLGLSKARKVLRLDEKTGKLIQEFESIASMAKFLGLKKSVSKTKRYLGDIWIFI